MGRSEKLRMLADDIAPKFRNFQTELVHDEIKWDKRMEIQYALNKSADVVDRIEQELARYEKGRDSMGNQIYRMLKYVLTGKEEAQQ